MRQLVLPITLALVQTACQLIAWTSFRSVSILSTSSTPGLKSELSPPPQFPGVEKGLEGITAFLNYCFSDQMGPHMGLGTLDLIKN